METSQPRKRRSRGVLIGALAGAGALLLAIAVAVFWAVWYAPAHVTVQLERARVHAEVPPGSGGLLGTVLRGAASQLVVETTLAVDNKNLFGARLESLTFRVRVNGRDIGEGSAPVGAEGLRVQADGRTSVPVVTRFPMTSLAGTGIDVGRSGRFAVEIEGRAQLSILSLPITRDFVFRDLPAERVSLEEIPRLR